MRVYLEPIGGLCNRMRVIASAYDLLKSRGGRIVVNWVANEELNCPSKELFSLPAGIHVLELSDATKTDRLRMKLAERCFGLLCRKRVGDSAVAQCKQTRDVVPEDRTYYQTCETFHVDPRGVDFGIFNPNPHLLRLAERKIAQISEGGKHRVIGVHIRRTDHTESIQDSPTELFCRVLNTWLSKDKTVRFYIATDDLSVRDFFSQRYNRNEEVVFFSDSTALRRDTAEGIKAAYVELMTLSLTELIYGSSGSSYSYVAASLRNTPLETINEKYIEGILRSVEIHCG